MILGQSPKAPTAAHPIDFTPPTVGGGNIFSLPKTGFYSHNIWPFSQVMGRTHAYPAYHPVNPRVGPQQMPQIAPPPVASPMAPAPGPSPAGTSGAFGGAGFGSSGGVRPHSHIDPYNVMRSGMIPGVSPSGSNIRAGYANAGARVEASMPFQSRPFPVAPPAPSLSPALTPAGTAGFGGAGLGGSWWNPFTWFSSPSRPTGAQMVAAQTHGFGAARRPRQCEVIGPRLDGTRVTICNGRVTQVEDANGNVLWNAYNNPNAY